MIIHYFDSWEHEKTLEIKAKKQIEPDDHNGHPCIKNMKRVNDAQPERLDVLKTEEIRNQELENI